MLAHELVHIKRNDTVLSAVAVVVALPWALVRGTPAAIGTVHDLVGRGREFSADQRAALIVRYPTGIGSALEAMVAAGSGGFRLAAGPWSGGRPDPVAVGRPHGRRRARASRRRATSTTPGCGPKPSPSAEPEWQAGRWPLDRPHRSGPKRPDAYRSDVPDAQMSSSHGSVASSQGMPAARLRSRA